MSFTHVITQTVNDGRGNIGGSISASADAEISFDGTITAPSTNLEIDLALTAANLKSVALYCDQALTVKTNGRSNTYATNNLVSDNTNVSNNDTVVINGRTYTFKTSLTDGVVANEVLIGADADGSLTNLKSAINHTGTSGTDYGSATTINADVTAGTIASHTLPISAKSYGTAGNAITTTETSSHLSFSSSTLLTGDSIQETISLVAKQPKIWTLDRDGSGAIPFSGDVSKIYVTLGGSTNAAFKVRCLSDQTP